MNDSLKQLENDLIRYIKILKTSDNKTKMLMLYTILDNFNINNLRCDLDEMMDVFLDMKELKDPFKVNELELSYNFINKLIKEYNLSGELKEIILNGYLRSCVSLHEIMELKSTEDYIINWINENSLENCRDRKINEVLKRVEI